MLNLSGLDPVAVPILLLVHGRIVHCDSVERFYIIHKHYYYYCLLVFVLLNPKKQTK